jgi:hypothetical protein
VSTRHIPYGSEFDIDYHREAQQRRVDAARKQLDVSDVLSQIDDLIASEPDPTAHPLYGLAAWLLDQTWACDGGALFDRCKALCLTAIDRLVEQHLQGGG